MASNPLFGPASNDNFTPTGIVDQSGNAFYKGPPVPGASFKSTPPGGGEPRVSLEQNVRGLNWAVGLLIPAFGAAFIFFIMRIDERFDRVDQPLRQVQMSVAGQAEALKSIAEQLNEVKRQGEKQVTPPDSFSSATNK